MSTTTGDHQRVADTLVEADPPAAPSPAPPAEPDQIEPLLDEEPEAEIGSLDAEAGRDLALLQQFALSRERAMNKLFGRRLRGNPARDELLRLIVVAFSEGHCFRTSYYRQSCTYFENGEAVNREIAVLVSSGLVLLRTDPRFARAQIVVPTRRLVAFYNTQMPRLRAQAMALLSQ